MTTTPPLIATPSIRSSQLTSRKVSSEGSENQQRSLSRVPSDASLRTKLGMYPTTESVLLESFQSINHDRAKRNDAYNEAKAKAYSNKQAQSFEENVGKPGSPWSHLPQNILMPFSREEFDTHPRQTFISSQSENPNIPSGIYVTPKGKAISDAKLKRVSVQDTAEKKGMREQIKSLLRLTKK